MKYRNKDSINPSHPLTNRWLCSCKAQCTFLLTQAPAQLAGTIVAWSCVLSMSLVKSMAHIGLLKAASLATWVDQLQRCRRIHTLEGLGLAQARKVVKNMA